MNLSRRVQLCRGSRVYTYGKVLYNVNQSYHYYYLYRLLASSFSRVRLHPTMACIKAHRTYLASSSSVTVSVWPLLRMQPTSSCSTPRKRDTTLCTPAQQQVQCSKKNGRSRRGLGVLSWESWRSAKAGARRDSRRAQVASRRPLPRAIFFPPGSVPVPVSARQRRRGAGWADGRRPSVALAVRLVRCGRGW